MKMTQSNPYRSRTNNAASIIVSVLGIAVLVLLFSFTILVHNGDETNSNDGVGAVSSSSLTRRVTSRSGREETTELGMIDVWQDLVQTVTKEKLDKIAAELQEQYASAKPFPHIVIDGIFPQSILDALVKENHEALVKEHGCLEDKHFCINAKPGDTQYHKSALNEEEKMGPYTRMINGILKSGIFVEFLKEISGIRGLVPDPLYSGGGVHFTSNGGKLDIHSDFNKYPGPKLERRVNTFLFLNPDWKDEYGGHLELWSRDLKQCNARVAPILGRFAIFSTSDFSYHGHPNPLSAPPGRSRRSIATYYYTVGRPSEECVNNECSGHSTLWKYPDCDCLDNTCNYLDEGPKVFSAFELQ